MTKTRTQTDRSGTSYRWWLVLICMLILAVGSGTTIYLYSIVAGAVSKEYGALRASSMLGLTGMVILVALMSPKLGALVDKYSIRKVLYGGAIALGAGFIFTALTTAIWQVALIYAILMSIGLAALGQISTTALICQWFTGNRGLALGIVALGTQLGGFVFPPVIAYLMDMYGWRTALTSLGVFILLAMPLLVRITVRENPSGGNLARSDSIPIEDTEAINLTKSVITTTELLKNPKLWLIVLFVAASAGTNFSLIGNLANFATDLGESRENGAFLISVFALLGIVSSPLFGRYSDIVDTRTAAACAMVLTILSLLMFLQANSYGTLLAAAGLLGLGGGATFPLWAAMVSNFFPRQVIGRALGISTLFANPVMAFLALYSGWTFDLTGSYNVALLTMLSMCTAAAVGMFWSRFKAKKHQAVNADLAR